MWRLHVDENAPGFINLPSYILRKEYDKFLKREDYIKELKRKRGSDNKLGITFDEVIALNPANAKAKIKGKKAFNQKTGKLDYKANWPNIIIIREGYPRLWLA